MSWSMHKSKSDRSREKEGWWDTVETSILHRLVGVNPKHCVLIHIKINSIFKTWNNNHHLDQYWLTGEYYWTVCPWIPLVSGQERETCTERNCLRTYQTPWGKSPRNTNLLSPCLSVNTKGICKNMQQFVTELYCLNSHRKYYLTLFHAQCSSPL